MKIPENLKYTKSHEWVRVEGNEAYIGITDFAQGELGEIVFVEIETVGEKLAKEEAFGTIEAVKTVSDIFMPIAGEVLEVNPTLESNPSSVNTDPFGEGWLIKIAITNPAELNELYTAEQYKGLVNA